MATYAFTAERVDKHHFIVGKPLSTRRIRLRGVGPGLENRVWESTKALCIGRLENQEVMLDDSSISRRHAEVCWTEAGWILRDLGSTNGTYLNGVRIGRADHQVHKGDLVECGECGLLVVALEELHAAPAIVPPSGGRIECAVRSDWDLALHRAAALEAIPCRAGGTQFSDLLRMGRDFAHVATMDDYLRRILDDAVHALGSESAAIALVDEDTGRLTSQVLTTGAPEADPLHGLGLAQKAVQRGESILWQELADNQESDSNQGSATSRICALLRSPHRSLGVLQLNRSRSQPPFTRPELGLADVLATSISTTIESVASFLAREQAMFLQTLTALAQTVDLRDDYTGSHTQRVTDYALMLADALGLTAREHRQVQNGTPLHDLGKIGISDAILRKPGRLTPEEFEYMKSHTWKGAAILEAIPPLADLVPIVRNHHERWDGMGYPDRLARAAIPLSARIVAVADTFDAMTTDRPYRASRPLEEAIREIRAQAGSHFDPDCAEAFARLQPQLADLSREREQVLQTIRQRDLSIFRGAMPATGNRARTAAVSKKALADHLRQRSQGA